MIAHTTQRLHFIIYCASNTTHKINNISHPSTAQSASHACARMRMSAHQWDRANGGRSVFSYEHRFIIVCVTCVDSFTLSAHLCALAALGHRRPSLKARERTLGRPSAPMHAPAHSPVADIYMHFICAALLGVVDSTSVLFSLLVAFAFGCELISVGT
jgi:hypothetical protein